MNKKVLFCATVDYHFEAFHLPFLKWFQEKGWEVHVAAAGNLELPYVDQKYTIPISRSPFAKENVKAYKMLKTLIKKNQYKMVHCHTPVGGLLARLAAKSFRKSGTNVLYTAHGFHFCKGAPFINWLLYYPIEKWLARFTDCLITINHEDFQLAKSHRFKAQKIRQVHGVGVDTEVFKPVDQETKVQIRKQYDFEANDFLMFYAAEFNKNKNQQMLIQSLATIKDKVPSAKLLLAGQGPLLAECQQLAIQLGVSEMVHFLGYRKDIEHLLKMSDVAVASSFREGLPVNVMEAMACGLPVIASQNRGHEELVNDGVNGFIIPVGDHVRFAEKVVELAHSKEKRIQMGKESQMTMKQYNLLQVSGELTKIYFDYIMEDLNETASKYRRAYF